MPVGPGPLPFQLRSLPKSYLSTNTHSEFLKSIISGSWPQVGDATCGGKVFVDSCQHCHTIEKGGPHIFGPNLYSIFGQKSGQISGSKSSQVYKDSAIMWTPGTMVCFFKLSLKKEMCCFKFDNKCWGNWWVADERDYSTNTSKTPARRNFLGQRNPTRDWKMSRRGTMLLREFHHLITLVF